MPMWLEWTIATRFLREGRAHVHTGAGIVAGSVPEKEFEETEHKAAALRRAIEDAVAPSTTSRPSMREPREPGERGERPEPAEAPA